MRTPPVVITTSASAKLATLRPRLDVNQPRNVERTHSMPKMRQLQSAEARARNHVLPVNAKQHRDQVVSVYHSTDSMKSVVNAYLSRNAAASTMDSNTRSEAAGPAVIVVRFSHATCHGLESHSSFVTPTNAVLE